MEKTVFDIKTFVPTTLDEALRLDAYIKRCEASADFVAALGALKNPAKTATANTGKSKYTYATLDHMDDLVRSVFDLHSMQVIQPLEQTEHGDVIRTKAIHANGTHFDLGSFPYIVEKPRGKDDKQFLSPNQDRGSDITYSRRYALAAALGIAAEEDTDAAPTTGASMSAYSGQRRSIGERPAQPKKENTTPTEAADRSVAIGLGIKACNQALGDDGYLHGLFDEKLSRLEKSGDLDGLRELFTSIKHADRANIEGEDVDGDIY